MEPCVSLILVAAHCPTICQCGMRIVADALNLVVVKYGLFDVRFGQERNSLTDTGEIEEEFSMSAVDMSMIEHIQN